MAARADLRLALFVGTGTQIISLGELLADHAHDRGLTDVSPSYASMSLVVDGTERWGPRLSLGALGVLVRQLRPARTRLIGGGPALVRAGVMDVPMAGYLLFEPDGADVVASRAHTEQAPVTRWFPDEARGDELYAYFSEHRDDLVANEEVGPQRISLAGLLEDLEREIVAGGRAIDRFGPGVM